MAEITRLNGNVEPFGSDATGTNRTVFGDTAQSDTLDDNINADFFKGWEIIAAGGKPPRQFFNGALYGTTALISYLYQRGIAEWNTIQEFFSNSYTIGSDGKLYRSKTGTTGAPNQGNDPTTDTTNWQIFYQYENTGLKNDIINGAFSVQQRDDIDTAPVSTVTNTYQIDRFITYVNVITATTQRFSEQSVNGKLVNTIKDIATSTASGSLARYQKMENFYKGETKTFSVWVKSNSPDTRAMIYDGVTFHYSANHTGGAAWEKLTVTATIDASATLLRAYVFIGNDSLTDISITSGDYIESTMWQLEEGSVATPFEQRPIGLELSLCKRYYEVANYFYNGATDVSPSSSYYSVPFMVEKRVAPTCVASNFSNTTNCTGVSFSNSLTSGGLVIPTGSPVANTVTHCLFKYIADAEL